MSNTKKRGMTNMAGGAILGAAVGHADFAPVFDKQPNDPDPAVALLTVPEAAAFLRISKTGMRRLQQGRCLPFFKVRGSIRFARSDLLSYLARQRISSVGEYR
jgi:excisionase family DNA binding protein